MLYIIQACCPVRSLSRRQACRPRHRLPAGCCRHPRSACRHGRGRADSRCCSAVALRVTTGALAGGQVHRYACVRTAFQCKQSGSGASVLTCQGPQPHPAPVSDDANTDLWRCARRLPGFSGRFACGRTGSPPIQKSHASGWIVAHIQNHS